MTWGSYDLVQTGSGLDLDRLGQSGSEPVPIWLGSEQNPNFVTPGSTGVLIALVPCFPVFEARLLIAPVPCSDLSGDG